MKPTYRLDSHPVADPRAVVTGDGYRITVLTDGLVRLEHSPDGRFEDRASTFAINRALPVPEFAVHDRGDHLEVVTSRFRLTYDKGPFTTSGLSLAVGGGVSTYHSVWRFGTEPADLGGTARTLDEADGAIPLEPGVASRTGYAVIDDSALVLLRRRGLGRPAPARAARTCTCSPTATTTSRRSGRCTRCPARTPVLPRWALGNWWSRYYPYTADEYLALMTRFRAEGLPFSVERPRHGLARGRRGPDPRQRLDRLHLEPGPVPRPRVAAGLAARAGPAGDPQRPPGRRRAVLRGRLPGDGRGAGPRPVERRADLVRRDRPGVPHRLLRGPAPRPGGRRRGLLVAGLAVRAALADRAGSTRCGCSTTSTTWTTRATAVGR